MSDELSVGTLSGRIELEDRLTPAIESVRQQITHLEHSFGGLGERMHETAAGFLEAEFIMETIKEVSHKIVEEFELLTMHGSVIDDVAKNYERLTAQAGMLGEELLGQLKGATHGTIDDFQLMKRVNEDLATGTRMTNEQYTLLAQGAFALAKVSGGSVADAMDRINDAMITGRVRGVQLLTGRIDLTEAEQKFATAQGHSVDQLTGEGKLQAIRGALLAKVEEALHRVGDQTDSLKNTVEQGQAAWANFEDELDRSVATSPVIKAAFIGIEEALVGAFGNNKEESIKNITSAIEDAAVIAIDFGLGALEMARVVHIAWAAVETAVLGVEAVIVGIVTAIGEALLAAGKIGAAIHLIPQSEVDQVQETQNALRAMTGSLIDQTAEAAKGVVGHSELDKTLDKMGGTLFQVKDKMEAAKQKTVEHDHATGSLVGSLEKAATGHQKLGAESTKTGELFKESAESVKQYAAAWHELSSVGTDFADTVGEINPKLVEQIRYYLEAGIAVGVLAKAYPQLTEAQVHAISELDKANVKIQNELVKASEAYFKAVNAGSHDATKSQMDDAYLVAEVRIAQMKKTASYSVEAEMLIWSTAKQTADNIVQKELELDEHTKEHYQLLADKARIAYAFALDHMNSYTNAEIQQLKAVDREATQNVMHWTSVATQAITETGKTGVDVTHTWQYATDQWNKSVMALGETYTSGVANWTERTESWNKAVMDVNRSLDGTIKSAQELQRIRDMGGSMDIGHAARDPEVMQLLHEGWSFENAMAIKLAHQWNFQPKLYDPLGNPESRPSAGERVPGYASGIESAPGGWSMVGEAGPEMMYVPQSASIRPNGGGGGSVTNYFYINGSVKDIVRPVIDELTKQMKQARLWPSA